MSLEPSRRTLLGALIAVTLAGCGERVEAPASPVGRPAAQSAELTAAITSTEQRSLAALAPGPGQALVVANCLICHSATMVEQQRKDTTAWNKTVTQMIAWGAPLPAAQKPVLVAYLAEHYGARAAAAPPRR